MKDGFERGWRELIYDVYLCDILGIIPTFHLLKYIYTHERRSCMTLYRLVIEKVFLHLKTISN